MARYPGATWKPLPQNTTQPTIQPVGAVLHTAVMDHSPWSFFRSASADGVESTFYVGEHGEVEQFMDTARRADCQLDGNSWLAGDGRRYGFVSIESWDGGHPETTPWTAQQVDALVSLLAWLARTHKFPPIKATGPRGRGIGYHAQFTDPDNSKALEWNHHHSCPAAKRIAQVPGIIRRVAAVLATTLDTSGDDMLTTAEINDLANKTADVLLARQLTPGKDARRIGGWPDGYSQNVATFTYGTDAKVNAIRRTLTGMTATLGALKGSLDAVTAALAAHEGGSDLDVNNLIVAVRQAAEDGAKAAITAGVLDVDVTVHDKTLE